MRSGIPLGWKPQPEWKPQPKKPRREPAVIAAEKAYRSSNQYALDKLIKVRTRYRNRLTKAQNGLDKVQGEIEKLLGALCAEKMGDKR